MSGFFSRLRTATNDCHSSAPSTQNQPPAGRDGKAAGDRRGTGRRCRDRPLAGRAGRPQAAVMRIWHKLVLICAAFTIPLAVTTSFLVSEQRIKIDFASDELAGDAYLRPLAGL